MGAVSPQSDTNLANDPANDPDLESADTSPAIGCQLESLNGDAISSATLPPIGDFDDVLDDLASANEQLATASAAQIVRWAAAQGGPIMLSTSMGAGSAVMLHLIAEHAPEAPVVWADTGYNTPDTYRFAEQMQETLDLDLRVYTPLLTTAHSEAI